jgi:phosphoribosyl 1,2-cyclic phosphate phosphodiesterase
MDATTRRALRTRFGYCFDVDPDNGYPAILDDAGELVAQQPVAIDGPGGTLTVVPLDQDHGGRPSLGFRFGCGDWMPVAYSNDCVALPERTLAGLTGLDLWIADAMRHRPHPTHAHLDQTLAWHRRLAPRRTVLTNLHVDMDYAEVQAMTPVEVEPAQDGLRIELHFP